MPLTPHLSELVGKTITGVVVKEAKNPVAHNRLNVFLLFDDETYFEFYGNYFENGQGVKSGKYEEVMNRLPNKTIKFEFGN